MDASPSHTHLTYETTNHTVVKLPSKENQRQTYEILGERKMLSFFVVCVLKSLQQ